MTQQQLSSNTSSSSDEGANGSQLPLWQYEQPRTQELPPHFAVTWMGDRRYFNDGRENAHCFDKFFLGPGKRFEEEFHKLMVSEGVKAKVDLREMAMEREGPVKNWERDGFIPFYAVFVSNISLKLDAQIHQLMGRMAQEAGVSPRPIRYMIGGYPPEDWYKETYDF